MPDKSYLPMPDDSLKGSYRRGGTGVRFSRGRFLPGLSPLDLEAISFADRVIILLQHSLQMNT